jgi:hypothetical protein
MTTPDMTTRRPGYLVPLLGIVFGIAGTAVMWFSFSNGVSAALNGSGNGAGLFILFFFVGAALVLAAIVLGIAGLVRGGRRLLSVLALLVGLVPVVLVVLIWFVNIASVCCARPV